MKKVLLIQIFLLFFLLPNSGNAQKNYTVTHYTGYNGLPQNSVKSISADAQGFVWLATEDGLVRFDGQRFYVFNDYKLKIRWNRVNFILPGIPDSGVKARNKVSYAFFYNDEFARIENGMAILDTSYYKKYKSLLGSVEGKVTPYLSSGLPDILRGMDKDNRYMFPIRENGDFYLSSYNKVSFFSEFRQKFSVPFETGNRWNFFTIGKNLYYMHEDATFKSFSNGKLAEMALTGDLPRNTHYKGKDRVKIFWNNLSDQAFLYLDKKLYTLEVERSGSSDREYFVTKLLTDGFDLETNGIEEIYHDKVNRQVFFGSATNGLYVLSQQQFQALTIKGSHLENVFYAQLPYGKNAVFTAAGDIIGKEAASDKLIEQKLYALKAANLGNKRTMANAGNGRMWSTDGSYLYALDSISRKPTLIWKFTNTIQTIYSENPDYLWIAEFRKGLYRINLKVPAAKPELFLENTILEIDHLKLIDKNTLVAGTATGLYFIDIPSKKLVIAKGTEGITIKSIGFFDDGNIWVAAVGKGLMLVDKKRTLTTFPLDENRYLSNPHCIIDDGRGYLWIPTNKGLFQIAKKDLLDYAKLKDSATELFYAYHTKEEGFNTNEFNGSCDPCGLNLANGYISLPSLNGFVWFRPEHINSKQTGGEIILDNVQVNQKMLAASHDTIYFPLDPRQVQLNFSTAYFGNPGNLKISYALIRQNADPAPSDWISLDDTNFKILFSHLKSGKYTLIIRKLDGFGINNYKIKRLYFVVPLLWYQTWWANVLMVILLIAGIYFYNLWRLKKVKFENARLEEVVASRTMRLNETLTDLEESKNEMARQVHMLSRLLTSMTHDIQSPLNFIKLISGNIPKMIKNGQYEEVVAVGEVISDSSRSMSDLLRGLLDYIKAHVYENSLHFEYINVRQLVDEKFAIFKNMILENRTNFSNEIPDDIEVYCDYQMLGIMIHNLIDNAAKFTRGGEIRVFINTVDDNTKELVISNTTVGVPMVLQEMINSTVRENVQLKGVSKPGPGQSRTSLGLLIVKEIASLVGINLKVTQSNVTCFHLIFGNSI